MSRNTDVPESEATLAARALAHRHWAKVEDRTARTAPGRQAFEQRFLDQADGDPVKAESLRKAFYAELALKSVRARREKAARKAARQSGGKA